MKNDERIAHKYARQYTRSRLMMLKHNISFLFLAMRCVCVFMMQMEE